MKQHTYNGDCWCKPIILQLCLECFDAEAGFVCSHCEGMCLIPVYDEDRTDLIVIVHDHTVSNEFEGCHRSDITHTFLDPIPWQRIVKFFSMGKYI
jgi:hypothetical protein